MTKIDIATPTTPNLPEFPAGWMQVADGTGVDLLNPRVEDVNWNNIATSLALLCRYTGHVKDLNHFFSVAQHSVLVADLLPKPIQIYGLLHDCHEAFWGDNATPTKRAMATVYPDAARWLEDQKAAWDAVIWQAARLPAPTPDIVEAVKLADYQALAIEHNSIQTPPADATTRRAWAGLPDMRAFGVVPLPPSAAYDLFLTRLNDLLWQSAQEGHA